MASYRFTSMYLDSFVSGALACFRHSPMTSASLHTSTLLIRSGSTESAVMATWMHPSNARARETRSR